MLKWLVVALAIAGAMLLWRRSTHANTNLPRVGAPAPEFALPDQNGTVRRNADYRGKWLVLYFYPKDDTPGCIEQALHFRDALSALETLGATVCGISVDDSASHADFARKYKLPFTLLADRNGVTAARYGSLRNFGFVKFAKRNTFLIDPKGTIAKVRLGVSPSQNADDVAKDLKTLRG
jgi:thioredoxin-dependent peroxiredoxin